MNRRALKEEYEIYEPPQELITDEVGDCGRPNVFMVAMKRRGCWMLSRWKRFVQLAVVISIGLMAYRYVSAPPVVTLAEVKTVTTTESLGATGKVRGERVTDLGIDVAGVVKQIYIRAGDNVRAGQLLLAVDRSALDARVQGAQAAVNSAMAELQRSARGPLAADVRRAQAELLQAQSVGQARVAQAQARLRNLQAGTRSQEVSAAQAELDSKKQLLAKAQKDLKRAQSLVSQGAMAQSSLDSTQTDVETAKSAVIAQQAHLSLLKEGARPDQLSEAQAAVVEAKATSDTSVRAAREVINSLLSNPRPEDVRVGRSKVDEARAQLRQAIGDRAKTDLRAPYDGAIADIPVEAGQSVSPGQKLIVLHEMRNPIIEVETDEQNLSSLSIGQKALITADAYPGRSFEAVVTDLGSMVNPERGTIEIKLRPTSRVSWLRPDLTVDVNIITKRGARNVILPADTLTKYKGQSTVLVVKDGIARPVAVTTGAIGPKGVVVVGSIKDGEVVARNASRVTPNGAVKTGRGR